MAESSEPAESGERQLPLWPFCAAIAIAVVGLLAALLWPDPEQSLQLRHPDTRGGGFALGDASTGPYRYADIPLCVAHGTVSITDVTLRDADHLSVVDWGVASVSEGNVTMFESGKVAGIEHIGSAGKDVRTYPHRPVEAGCSDTVHPGGQGFVVSLRRTADDGSATAIVVHSTSGTVTLPITVHLCASKDCPTLPEGS